MLNNLKQKLCKNMKNKGQIWTGLLFVFIIIALFLIVGYFSAYFVASLKIIVALVGIGFMSLIGYHFYRTGFRFKGRTPKILGLFLILLFVFVVGWVQFGGIVEKAIITEYIQVKGKTQTNFARCNPCEFYIDMYNEEKPFEDVRFDFLISGDTYQETGCVPLEAGGGYSNCQKYGYYDSYVSGCGCKSYERCCYRRVSCDPGRTQLKYDTQVLWDSTINTEKTDNMADILTSLNPSIGKDCAIEDCPHVHIYFKVYSENNCGSYDISSTPTVLVRGEAPTTTTTLITTTVPTTIKGETTTTKVTTTTIKGVTTTTIKNGIDGEDRTWIYGIVFIVVMIVFAMGIAFWRGWI